MMISCDFCKASGPSGSVLAIRHADSCPFRPFSTAAEGRTPMTKTILISRDWNGGTVASSNPELIAEFIEGAERAASLRARWPANGAEAMTALARLFPTMRDVEACDPFSPMALVAWLNSGASGSGSRHAAMFLLNVWNMDTDWRAEGLKVRAGQGRFNFARAVASWDAEHRAACAAWLEAPFHP